MFSKKAFRLALVAFLVVGLAYQSSAQGVPVSTINLEDLEGKYFTGGSLNLGTRQIGMVGADNPNNNGFGVGIDAYVGKFATNRLAYGLNVGYRYNSFTSLPDTDLETTSSDNLFNVGVFGRAYSNPCAPNVNGYLQGEVGFGFGNQKFTNNSGDETIDGLNDFRIGVVPGIVLYPTDHIMLELQYGFLGYQSRRTTYDDISTGEEVQDYSRWGGFDFDAKTLTICLMYMLPYPSWNDKMNDSFDGFGKF